MKKELVRELNLCNWNWPDGKPEGLCNHYCEGSTLYCGSHNTYLRKIEKELSKPKKQVKRIAKFSEKMKGKLKAYRELNKEYLASHPYCLANLPGCTKKATQVHHLGGRGSKLNAVDTFMALCDPCHKTIHNKLSATERRNKKLML